MFFAVIGMSISYLVYIIIGQYFGAYVLGQRMGITPFEIEGYQSIFPPRIDLPAFPIRGQNKLL